MGELVDRDQEHLNLLKLGFYVLAGIHCFFSLFALIYIVLGGLFASGALPVNSAGHDSAVSQRLMGTIFLLIGGGFLVVGLAGAFLTFWAGRSIAERRRRVFCLVMAGLNCLSIPWGTAMGVCAILVLSRPSVIALFEGPTAAPLMPSALPPGGGSAN